jgi:hypothetical protein
VKNPKDYLSHFYEGALETGSIALLEFYAEAYANLHGANMIEFGGGPTVYSLIAAAKTAGAIHFTDGSDQCLDQVRAWLTRRSDAFDWKHYIRFALRCEDSGQEPSQAEVAAREELIREKIVLLSRCDAFAEDPLLGFSRGPYEVVGNNFCLDGITDSRATWIDLNKRIARLLSPGGLFLTAAIKNASYWRVGDVTYPAVRLGLADVISLYEELRFVDIRAKTLDLADRSGYDGILMVCGRRDSRQTTT